MTVRLQFPRPLQNLILELQRLPALLSQGNYQWRRVRYSNPVKAAKAFKILAEAGAVIELRFRDGASGKQLYVGLALKWMMAFKQMSADEEFGLVVAPDGAKEPKKPQGSFWVPGNDGPDIRITAHGMYVAKANPPDQSKLPGAPVVLPEPELGVNATPKILYSTLPPSADHVWQIGGSGLTPPLGLIGETNTKIAYLIRLFLTNVNDSRPIVVLDGNGQLAYRMRLTPEIIKLFSNGNLLELSLSRSSQLGFNPLAEAQADDDEVSTRQLTLQRWRWWWRGLGVHDESLLLGAYEQNARTLRDVQRLWSNNPAAKVAVYSLQSLLQDGPLASWLTGSFDVVAHLQSGKSLLVECPTTSLLRLQAARGLVGLAMEGRVRLISFGVKWSPEDEPALRWLDAICADRRWDSTIFGRCTSEQVEAMTNRKWFEEPQFGEYLINLPNDTAIIYQGGEWWETKLL